MSQNVLKLAQEMIKMKKVLLSAITALGLTSVVFASEPAPKNVIKNPSFETGEKPWGKIINAGKFNFSIDSTVAHNGKKSAKLKCTAIDPEADGTWRQPKAWARWVLKVTVKPGAKYHFRCFARGEKGDNARVTVFITGNEKPAVISFGLPLDGENWIELEDNTFKAKGNTAVIYLNYYGEGSAWFDDVEMIEIE